MGSWISPTQVGTAGTCGWAYEYAYKLKYTRPSTPVPLLTGSVLHQAREKWIVDHTLDLVDLTKRAWRDLSQDSPLYPVVEAYEKLSAKSRALCAQILLDRPDIKVPAMTKDYKQSEIGKTVAQFEKNRAKQLAQDKHDWEGHSFTTAYDETIRTAEKYQERYRDSPPALVSENKFTCEVDGLTLTGVLDDIRLVVSKDYEPLAYGIVDAKTYSSEPEPLKDFVQLATYRIAAQENLPLWLAAAGHDYIEGLDILCGIDLMSMLEYRWYSFTREQLGIALDIIRTYDRYRATQGILLPNFKGKCDWCEWKELCRSRVGMEPLALETA